MGVREEKTLGWTERNLPDFFGLCPRCQKHFPEKLSKIVVDGGGGGRSNYEKFLLDSIFPTKLTEFPTKLTEFVPFIFIISQYCPTVKRIFSDWLCLPNKLGGGGGTPMVKVISQRSVKNILSVLTQRERSILLCGIGIDLRGGGGVGVGVSVKGNFVFQKN